MKEANVNKTTSKKLSGYNVKLRQNYSKRAVIKKKEFFQCSYYHKASVSVCLYIQYISSLHCYSYIKYLNLRKNEHRKWADRKAFGTRFQKKTSFE